MKYFFPDSQDLVDPSFDFERERRNDLRLRQRDDLYAHEIFKQRAYDGLLVSKGIVDGVGGVGGRYSIGQRQRLLRNGAREFFRLDRVPYHVPVMGDCGAFTYVKEDKPPYSVDDVLSFYVDCRFDFGISVDHVILEYEPDWDAPGQEAPASIKERQEITLELAAKFLKAHRAGRCNFEPLGVAQGWSPKSYAQAVKALQKIGFKYIALGGMVPLKSPEILACVQAVGAVRKPDTKFHLLGVTRLEHLTEFASHGVASFDSTSPLRQAFKDDTDNYYTLDRAYTAVRVPQVEGNPGLQKRISSGKISQDVARRLELACLKVLREFASGAATMDAALTELMAYEELYAVDEQDTKKTARAKKSTRIAKHREAYREVLSAKPWTHCACEICRALGHHVVLFRGAERNRRRGLHNVWTFYRRLRRDLGLPIDAAA